MSLKLLSLIAASFIALSGCASLSGKLPMLAVDNRAALIGEQITYQLQWQEGKNSGQMLLVLAHGEDSVQLVGLSNTSVSLFSLQRDHKGDTLEKSYFYRKLPDAQQLLNRLLMAYYSEAYIQQQLGEDWQLVETAEVRQWFYLGKLQLTIVRAEQGISLQSPKQRLHLTIIARESVDSL